MRRAPVLLLATLAAVAACSAPDTSPIVSATWEQSQALPDFDGGPGEVTDPAQLAALAEVLDDHDIEGQDVSIGESCPGSRSTDITYETEDGGEFHVSVDTCEDDEAAQAIDGLVSGWRTS